MSDLKKCPHDEANLVDVDWLNPAKAGRLRCMECNCSFMGEELATRGETCAFFAPKPAVEEEPVAAVEAAVEEEPAAVEEEEPAAAVEAADEEEPGVEEEPITRGRGRRT